MVGSSYPACGVHGKDNRKAAFINSFSYWRNYLIIVFWSIKGDKVGDLMANKKPGRKSTGLIVKLPVSYSSSLPSKAELMSTLLTSATGFRRSFFATFLAAAALGASNLGSLS